MPSKKLAVMRFVACFSLCLGFLCSSVVFANAADSFTPYDSRYGVYDRSADLDSDPYDGIAFRLNTGSLSASSLSVPADSTLTASLQYWSDYTLTVPSSTGNIVGAFYINLTRGSAKIPVDDEGYSSSVEITSWVPLMISNSFAPEDHDRTVYFNLSFDSNWIYTSGDPTNVRWYNNNLSGSTLTSGCSYIGVLGANGNTSYQKLLRFSVVIPAGATEVWFSLPGTLSRSSQTLYHYGELEKSLTSGSISVDNQINGYDAVSGQINVPWNGITVKWYANYDSSGKLLYYSPSASQDAVHASFSSTQITSHRTIVGTDSISSLTTYTQALSYNQAICIYSSGTYIVDSGTSVVEQQYLDQNASTDSTITSVETTEHIYQDNAVQSINSLNMDTYSFSSGMVSGIVVVGTIFGGLWGAIGDVKDFYLFVLMLGVALVVLGRIAKDSIKEEKTVNKKGGKK